MTDPTPPAAPRPCGHERLDDDGCCKACGVDIFAPRPRERAEPMSDERLAQIRKRVAVLPAWELIELLAEVDRLRASLAPSRESGALLERLLFTCDRASIASTAFPVTPANTEVFKKAIAEHDAARAAVDRHLATLERDAARMREAAAQFLATIDRDWTRDGSPSDAEARQRALTALRAALAPSGEPTTKGDSK